MVNKNLKIISILVSSLIIILAIVSYYGAFAVDTYGRETASMAAQGIGQDIVNLFLVVPLLIVFLILLLKNSEVAFYLIGGTVFYVLYSFVIYSFGVNFNKLFLLYCLTLGISLYTFILTIYQLNGMEVHNWPRYKLPVHLIGVYFIFISAMFYLLWLKEIIPAIANNSVPKSVSDYDLLVNPVHVLDIAIALPGLIITAILLMKKHRLGYILTPMALVFIILLAFALVGMVIMLDIRNISEDISIAAIFILIALISFILLYVFLSKIKINIER
jgi:hypothetical protein